MDLWYTDLVLSEWLEGVVDAYWIDTMMQVNGLLDDT